jgi:hypothetical protein
MIKTTVEHVPVKAVFELGELVELDKAQFEDGKGYIVLITKVMSNTNLFGGVVVQSDEDDGDIFVGNHSLNFTRHSFTKFVGKLTMVSS